MGGSNRVGWSEQPCQGKAASFFGRSIEGDGTIFQNAWNKLFMSAPTTAAAPAASVADNSTNSTSSPREGGADGEKPSPAASGAAGSPPARDDSAVDAGDPMSVDERHGDEATAAAVDARAEGEASSGKEVRQRGFTRGVRCRSRCDCT